MLSLADEAKEITLDNLTDNYVGIMKVSFSILNRSLSDFAMTVQLLAMNNTTYSVYGGAYSLDFNHYSNSY